MAGAAALIATALFFGTHFKTFVIPPGAIALLLLGLVSQLLGGQAGHPWTTSDRVALVAMIIAALSFVAVVVIGVIQIVLMS